MNTKPAQPSLNPLTASQAKSLLKEGSLILWPYRGNVKEGTVQFVNSQGAAVLWLEGYTSRNDTVPFDEVLSVYCPKAPKHKVGVFSGHGFLTQAGATWQADEVARNARAETISQVETALLRIAESY